MKGDLNKIQDMIKWSNTNAESQSQKSKVKINK